MNHQPNLPAPDADAINERVKTAVHSHRIKLRMLNTAAFAFGFVALAAGIFIVWFYLAVYLPKQKDLLNYSQNILEQAQARHVSPEKGLQHIAGCLNSDNILIHVVSIGVTVVAVAVGASGLGTLILLTVVVLNRRIALNQINANLAQISNQLRELQAGRGGP